MSNTTTTTTRKTQRDFFNEVIALCRDAGRDDLVEFIEGRIAQLDKKNASSKKPTANQMVNETLMSDIEALVVESPEQIFTVTDFMKSVDSLNDLSNQKVNSLVNKLVKEHRLFKFYEKRRAYFRLPTADDDWSVLENGEE